MSFEEFRKILEKLEEIKRLRQEIGERVYPISIEVDGLRIIETSRFLHIIDNFNRLVNEVREVLTTISRWAQKMLYKLEINRGIRVSYDLVIDYDEYGYPYLMIKIKSIQEIGSPQVVIDKSRILNILRKSEKVEKKEETEEFEEISEEEVIETDIEEIESKENVETESKVEES